MGNGQCTGTMGDDTSAIRPTGMEPGGLFAGATSLGLPATEFPA